MKKARHLYIIAGIAVFVIICSVGIYTVKNYIHAHAVAAVSSNISLSSVSSKAVSSSASSHTSSGRLTGTDPTEPGVRKGLADSGYSKEQIDQSIKEMYNDGTMKNQTPTKPSGGATSSKPSNGTTSNKPSGGTPSSKPSTTTGNKDNTGDQGSGVYTGGGPLGTPGDNTTETHVAPGTGSAPAGPVEGHELH